MSGRLPDAAHIHGQSSAPTTEKICSAVASLTSASVGGMTLAERLARTTASVRAVISHMPMAYPPSPKKAKCPRERMPQYPQTRSIASAARQRQRVMPSTLVKETEIAPVP